MSSKIEEKEGWTTLHVPREVLEQIRKIREKEKGKATWEIVLEALKNKYNELSVSTPSRSKTKSKSEIDEVWAETVAYEIMKLSTNFIEFMNDTSDKKFDILIKRLQEAQRVLRIDTSEVQRMTEEYFKDKNIENKEKLFKAYQNLIKRIMIDAL